MTSLPNGPGPTTVSLAPKLLLIFGTSALGLTPPSPATGNWFRSPGLWTVEQPWWSPSWRYLSLWPGDSQRFSWSRSLATLRRTSRSRCAGREVAQRPVFPRRGDRLPGQPAIHLPYPERVGRAL